jgi:hypothetical protein
MSIVFADVNYICNNELKHRTVQVFLQEVDAEYGDLIYHTEVHWLGWGAVLQRFVDISSEVTKKFFLNYRMKIGIMTYFSCVTLPAT